MVGDENTEISRDEGAFIQNTSLSVEAAYFAMFYSREHRDVQRAVSMGWLRVWQCELRLVSGAKGATGLELTSCPVFFSPFQPISARRFSHFARFSLRCGG